eukprot:g4345.t1
MGEIGTRDTYTVHPASSFDESHPSVQSHERSFRRVRRSSTPLPPPPPPPPMLTLAELLRPMEPTHPYWDEMDWTPSDPLDPDAMDWDPTPPHELTCKHYMS